MHTIFVRKIPGRFNRSWVLILGLAAFGSAEAAGRFALKSATVEGGGNHSQGTRFAVEGTVGQTDAAPPSQSTRFTVSGGFWPTTAAPAPIKNVIFKNSFED